MIADSYTWNRLEPRFQRLIRSFQEKPPIDLRGLAKALNLPVKASTLPPNISGEIRPDGDGGYVIKVSRHDSHGRQRFTVAHEIAHFLLHRKLIGDGITDDVLYRSEQSDAVEAEANRLAADILMPANLLTEKYRTIKSLGGDEMVDSLAEIFSVSPAAMKIRLGG